MKTLRLIALTSLLAVTLTGCSLDINILPGQTTSSGATSGNSPTTQPTTSATSVIPTSIETKDRYDDKADYYHNVWYADALGIVENTYKEGGDNYDGVYNVYGGRDYYADPEVHNYDLIVPDSCNKSGYNTILLLIHGGSWITGSKSEVEDYAFDYSDKGYITANMQYSFLHPDFGTMSFSIKGFDRDVSVFRMLDEIDACIDNIKTKLVGLGFDGSKLKLVISGVSAGAHISMLYAYSRGEDSQIPISFIVDAVGPVDIQTASWKEFVDSSESVRSLGITPAAIAAQEAASNIRGAVSHFSFGHQDFNLPWNEYKTARYADAMCGVPYTDSQIKDITTDNVTIDMENEISQKLVNHYEKQVSVTNFIKDNDIPIIMGYGGCDSIVGIGQYARLEPVLASHSVEREFFYFKDSDHDLGSNPEVRDLFDAKIEEWLASK